MTDPPWFHILYLISPSLKMKLDPTKMEDWQVAEAAEETMKPVKQLADELGLKEEELLPMGRQLAKVDYAMAFINQVCKS